MKQGKPDTKKNDRVLQMKQLPISVELRNWIVAISNFAFFGYIGYLQIAQEKPDRMVLNILFGLYIVVLVLYSILAIRQTRYGLKGIIRKQKETKYKDISDQIKKAKNEIKIIVYHGENFLDATKKDIADAINRTETSVTVKLLIAKKESVLLKEVWELENKDENEYKRVSNAYSSIDKIKELTPDYPHRFDYLEYNTQIRYSIIIVDNKWAWWTPHHPGIKVEDTTSIVLTKKGGDSIILECIDHFERLWDKLDKERQCKTLLETQQCPKEPKTDTDVEKGALK